MENRHNRDAYYIRGWTSHKCLLLLCNGYCWVCSYSSAPTIKVLSKWYTIYPMACSAIIACIYYFGMNHTLLGKDYASEIMNDCLLNFSFQSNRHCVTLIDEEYGIIMLLS